MPVSVNLETQGMCSLSFRKACCMVVGVQNWQGQYSIPSESCVRGHLRDVIYDLLLPAVWLIGFAFPAAQDCPDGQYSTLEKSGKKQRSKPLREMYNGFTNYRMWGLAACYAYSFGVEVRSPPQCTNALVFRAEFSRFKSTGRILCFSVCLCCSTRVLYLPERFFVSLQVIHLTVAEWRSRG